MKQTRLVIQSGFFMQKKAGVETPAVQSKLSTINEPEMKPKF